MFFSIIGAHKRGEIMALEDYMNQPAPKYFSLFEYVKRIQLSPDVLEHMEETNQTFDEYLKKLSKYDDYSVIYHWITKLFEEFNSSQQIESSHIISPSLIESKNVFFDSLSISHKRIKELHQFVMGGVYSEYRTQDDVRVSRLNKNYEEEVFWWAPKVEDMKLFLKDFIEIYRSKSLSVLNTNPFFKSALLHLLFVRIHPFTDGNGRTARMLHSMKFTELINQIYGMRLKISPLNLSQSILQYQPTYVKRIDQIYFDLEHDCNKELNQWFDFMLNRVDDQLHYFNSHSYKLDYALKNISKMSSTDSSSMTNEIQKMHLRLK